MSVIYHHLAYEEYKALEEQMKAFKETQHTSTGGFYHKSIRLKIGEGLIIEFHGPLVGGYGHQPNVQIQLDSICSVCGATQEPTNFALCRNGHRWVPAGVTL